MDMRLWSYPVESLVRTGGLSCWIVASGVYPNCAKALEKSEGTVCISPTYTLRQCQKTVMVQPAHTQAAYAVVAGVSEDDEHITPQIETGGLWPSPVGEPP